MTIFEVVKMASRQQLPINPTAESAVSTADKEKMHEDKPDSNMETVSKPVQDVKPKVVKPYPEIDFRRPTL